MAVQDLVNISDPLLVLLEKKAPFAHGGYVHVVTTITGHIQLIFLITSVTPAIMSMIFQEFSTTLGLPGVWFQ